MRAIVIFLGLTLFLSKITYGDDTVSEGVNRIIAVVNDEIITQRELEHKKVFLLRQIKQAYGESKDISDIEQKDIERMVVEKLIMNKLIMQEARRQNIVVTEGEVKERIDSVRRRFPNEASFMANLQEAGLTIEDLKESYEYEIIMHKVFFDKARGEIVITPREIEDFYKQHSMNFQEPEKVRVKNIFIKKEKRSSEEISRKLEEVSALLKEGVNFEDVARKYSEGANAFRGGEMGEIRRNELSLNVENIIFNLKPDEISNWIETDSGFYLFKSVERTPARVLNFDEAQGQIKTVLFNQKIDEKFDNWIAKLKEKAYIALLNK